MTITLGLGDLQFADVVEVARKDAPVALDEGARSRLVEARELIERMSRENRPVYGLTRGLGHRVTQEVSEEDRLNYSARVVRGRATGGGGYFDRETTRAALFARAAGLAMGGAGVRPLIVDTQMQMLEKGVHPLVPMVGSVGASDLALCANLAMPILGEGRAEYMGEILPGAEAMKRAGIPTVDLLEKEGLALCSNNAISVGLGALVLQDMTDLLRLADAIVALSFEAFRGNPSPMDPRISAARPAPGQADSAASICAMLQGSSLFEEGQPRRVQDPISFRCAANIHGALRVGIEFARPNVEVELNGAADNPLILLEDEEVLSTGNFHTSAMSIAFDALRLAVAEVSSMSTERSARMMMPGVSGFDDRIAANGVTRVGLMLINLSSRTLNREVRYYANPVSHDDTCPAGVEDQAPFTPMAVRRCRQQLGYLQEVLACELIMAAQALDWRMPDRLAPVAQALHALVRTEVPDYEDDRGTTEDIEKVTEMVRSGAALKAVDAALGA